MQNESKPVKFGILAKQIVRKLQARHSKTPRYLKVIPCNPSQKIPVKTLMREDKFRDAPSRIPKTRKINQAR